MSKKQAKSQASSSRVGLGHNSDAFGSVFGSTGSFGAGASPLSYLAEQPDPSSLSDPNVVVNFKNLSKKDGTTKAKALEELQVYIDRHQQESRPLEEAFLESWVKVFPRASIDLSSRVRQNAHTTNGKISTCAGKAIAKHMPRIVGPWLCGIHDGDKSVMRSAQDALDRVFPTEEKKEGLNKIYQRNILEHCRDAILKENPKTLNDERNTTTEDAESAYARVVSASLAEVTALLNALPVDELRKQREIYDELLKSESLWAQSSSQDPQVRRNLLRFLIVSLNKQKELIIPQFKTISSNLLSKKSLKHQSGSSYDFSEALIRLTELDTGIWMHSTTSKSSVLERLGDWIKHGSQGGPPQLWTNFCKLVRTIPQEHLQIENTHLEEFFKNIRFGLQRRDEPRSNLSAAWKSYLDLVRYFVPMLPVRDQNSLLSAVVSPLIRQYLRPNEESSAWSVPALNASEILVEALSTESVAQNLVTEWSSMGDQLLHDIRNSVTQESSDSVESQKALAFEGDRFFLLQAELLKISTAPSTQAMTREVTQKIVSECDRLVAEQKGSPVGVTRCLDSALKNMGNDYFMEHKELKSIIDHFLTITSSSLVFSQSQPQLFSILNRCQGTAEFEKAWKCTLDAILSSEDSQNKLDNVIRYICVVDAAPTEQNASENAKLRTYLLDEVNRKLRTDAPANWKFLADFMKSPLAYNDDNSSFAILSTLFEGLAIDDTTPNALRGLQTASESNISAMKPILISNQGSDILGNLLRIQEAADDEDAKYASDLSGKFESLLSKTSSAAPEENPLLKALLAGVHNADENALAIDTLVGLGRNILKGDKVKAEMILPNLQAWSTALEHYYDHPIPRPFIITNELGGALNFINGPADPAAPEYMTSPRERPTKSPKDLEGLSAPIRMAWYITKLLNTLPSIADAMVTDYRAKMFELLSLTRQLASDELTYPGANNIWRSRDKDVEEEAISFLSETQELICKWLREAEAGNFLENAQDALLGEVECEDTRSFHHARAYVTSKSQAIELKPLSPASAAKVENELKAIAKSDNQLRLATMLAAYKPALSGSPYVTRLVNELISDATSLDITHHSEIRPTPSQRQNGDQCLWKLVHLNLILHDNEDVLGKVATQRIIFLVMHVVSWLPSSSNNAPSDDTPAFARQVSGIPLQAETCKVLAKMLPKIEGIYGEHWSNTIDFLPIYWLDPQGATSFLPVYHASLKLFQTIRRLETDADANEDLKEAWEEKIPELTQGVIALFHQLGGWRHSPSQPFDIVEDLVARQMYGLTIPQDNMWELFWSLSSGARPVQRTAFDILHKAVPKMQEQISLDSALESSEARLPDYLLSLVLKAPSPETVEGRRLERKVPKPVVSYLSSWLLVFDCFKGASDKVRSDYADHLKENDYVSELLTLAFNFLGHSKGRPVDASRFDPTTYSFDIEDSPSRDLQWLLIHLYYLCLKRVPSLTKSWWIDHSTRQAKTLVESWTEKHISPIIISEALDTVSGWSRTQDSNAEDALLIKTNQRTKEITCQKEIDDQLLSMVVRLPANFPLGQAVVEGVNRVGVDEHKWRSWLLNTQGVITFSDNSLVDGLMAFRRNVVGQLKGQTECAICYSIVSQDKQLPTKRCGTCSNLFHGSCLYRWFKSSNSSSCPLCRTPFNYA